MDITITLSDAEVAALQSEQQPDEVLSDVLRRMIAPLVGRAVKQQFNQLEERFDALPLAKQVKVITQLIQLFPKI